MKTKLEFREMENKTMSMDDLDALQRDIDNKIIRQVRRHFEIYEDDFSKRDVNKLELANLKEKAKKQTNQIKEL